jgi:hypothetical protein
MNPVERVEKPQVESQVAAPRKTGVDGRRNNGGTPPRQKPGSHPKYSPIARRAMSLAAKKQQPARTAS